MKIEATTIEELFIKSKELGAELKKFDAYLLELMPNVKRQLFTGYSITMIGYGEAPFKRKSCSGVWPVISIAPQKNGVSLYIAAQKNGMELAEYYKGKLGTAQYGKKTIRFKRFDSLDKTNLRSLIYDAFKWQNHHKNMYGRNCAKPIK